MDIGQQDAGGVLGVGCKEKNAHFAASVRKQTLGFSNDGFRATLTCISSEKITFSNK